MKSWKTAGALAVLATVSGIASESSAWAGSVRPAPATELPDDSAILRYDLSHAVAMGRLTAGGGTTPIEGNVNEEDGALVIALPGFGFGLVRGSDRTARANLRAAIPTDTLPGTYPATLEATVEFRAHKALGSSLVVSLNAAFLATPGEPAKLAWDAGDFLSAAHVQRLTHVVNLDEASTRARFCGAGAGRGVLTVDLAFGGERTETSRGEFLVTPALGDDLVVVVKPGAVRYCD
jgi:hypothetical protein